MESMGFLASTESAPVTEDGALIADGMKRVDLSKFGENPWQQITK